MNHRHDLRGPPRTPGQQLDALLHDLRRLESDLRRGHNPLAAAARKEIEDISHGISTFIETSMANAEDLWHRSHREVFVVEKECLLLLHALLANMQKPSKRKTFLQTLADRGVGEDVRIEEMQERCKLSKKKVVGMIGTVRAFLEERRIPLDIVCRYMEGELPEGVRWMVASVSLQPCVREPPKNESDGQDLVPKHADTRRH